jgi:hypothetical protein
VHHPRIPVVSRRDGHGASFVVPRSIASDCSVDVTVALQSWIDATPDDVHLLLRPEACYRVEGTLTLANRRAIVLDGRGARLVATTPGMGSRLQVRARSQLNIIRSDDITVRYLVVRGANPHAGTSLLAYQPRFEAQHAFDVLADNNLTLESVAATDVYGDFVYIGGSAPSRDITVTRSNFARSGRQGISVTDAVGVTISHNVIRDAARSLIDLEPNLASQPVRDINIVDNTTGAARNFWIADKGAGTNIGDITVQGNVMDAPTGGLVFIWGPKTGKRGPFALVDNTLRTAGTVTDDHAVGALVFANASVVSVAGNHLFVPPQRGMPAVQLVDSDKVTVSGNDFIGTTRSILADTSSREVRAQAA